MLIKLTDDTNMYNTMYINSDEIELIRANPYSVPFEKCGPTLIRTKSSKEIIVMESVVEVYNLING